MKIQLKKYAIEVLILLSVVYLVISFVVSETQILLWITALFLVINYSVSLTELFRQGKITFSQILINIIQLALFCRLHILIHDVLGAEHYSYALEPHWYDWVELVAVHVLRAVDLLDILSAYGVDLQNIDHQSILAGIVLVSMHIMVDIFILGAIIMVIKRLLANQKPSSIMKYLKKEGFFTTREAVDPIFGIGIVISGLISGLIIEAAMMQQKEYSQIFLWLLDNFLRTLDFGDAFQIFDWQLHSVKMGMGLATWAIIMRFFMSFYAIRLINSLHLIFLGGRGNTVEELGKISASDTYDWEVRKNAVEALARLGSDAVIPYLVIALADSDKDIRSTAEKALMEVDPQWRESEDIQIALSTLVTRLPYNSTWQYKNETTAVALALGTIGKASAKYIPNLLVALVNFTTFDEEFNDLRQTVIDVLEKIDRQWQNSEEIQSAISELVTILLDKDNSRKKQWNAAKVLGKIGPAAATAVPHLITAFEKHNDAVTTALEEMGPVAIEAVPTLLTALAKNEHVSHVIRALAQIKPLPEQAIPNLVIALEDSDVRCRAVRALGNVELVAIHTTLPFIAKALGEEYKDKEDFFKRHRTEDVHNAAAEVLSKMDENILENISPAIAQEVVPLLAKALRRSYVDSVQSATANVLKKMGKIAIPPFLKMLADEDEYIRISAAEALGKIGQAAEPAIPELLKTALADSNSYVRDSAAKALEKIGHATNQVVSPLVTALESNDNSLQIRQNAAKALGNIGQIAIPAIPHLITALKDKEGCATALEDTDWWGILEYHDGDVRSTAAEALGKIGPDAVPAVPSLMTALKDQEAFVQIAAAEALGQIGPTAAQAVPSLMTALKDKDVSVQSAAAKALGKIGATAATAKAVPSLMIALEDSDLEVRYRAAEALGKIGTAAAQAVPSLMTALKDEDNHVRLTTVIVITLGKIGPDAALAIHHLITMLNDSNQDVRLYTIEAMGDIGSAAYPAVPSLMKVWANNWRDNDEQRKAIEKALNNIGPATIPYLATALEDSNRDVRFFAVLALRNIGSLATIPHLVTALADSDKYIRQVAKKALDEIDPTKKIRKPALRKQSLKWYVKYMFWYLKDSMD